MNITVQSTGKHGLTSECVYISMEIGSSSVAFYTRTSHSYKDDLSHWSPGWSFVLEFP